jgi:hypothetical protein
MTAGMVHGMLHVTNLTPGSGGNPRRAYGQRHQLMAAGMVHVTNLTPGSGVTALRHDWRVHVLRGFAARHPAAHQRNVVGAVHSVVERS